MKAGLVRQFRAAQAVPQDRIYWDIPDDFAEEVFDLYDPADVYSYLTTRERNQAYRDLQGIGANSKQIQHEWMKKAIWRIAQKQAWNDLELYEEGVEMSEKTINENKSRYLSQVEKIAKGAESLSGSSRSVIGAAGTSEVHKMILTAIDAAIDLSDFASDLLKQCESQESLRFSSPELSDAILRLRASVGSVSIFESAEIAGDIYIDPYESEYLPAEYLTENTSLEITEGVNEEDILPDEMDDDPDAMFTTDTEGMPVKYNNTPLDLDPFAVRLFRNNAELIDPPEVFDAVADSDETTEPEIEPGAASDETVDDTTREEFIDAVADTKENGDSEPEIPAPTELPSNDFDVFATESVIPTSTVTPKLSEDILPPQFSQTEAKRANENIANDPGNNLRMLAFLANADI